LKNLQIQEFFVNKNFKLFSRFGLFCLPVFLGAAAFVPTLALTSSKAVAEQPVEICFFTEPNMQGRKRCSVKVGKANIIEFNREQYSSVTVSPGYKVTIFSGFRQTGLQCVFLNDEPQFEGDCDNMANSVRIEEVSEGESARQSEKNAAESEPPPEPPARVCVYEDSDFGGKRKCYNGLGSVAFVGENLNDKISAVQMYTGMTVEVFEHANFEGRSQTLTCQFNKLTYLDDEVSSFVVRRNDSDFPCGNVLPGDDS
jgi:Peptidase inhibitor family I36